jgi:transposase
LKANERKLASETSALAAVHRSGGLGCSCFVFALYRERTQIERVFNVIKRFRAIATRYEIA